MSAQQKRPRTDPSFSEGTLDSLTDLNTSDLLAWIREDPSPTVAPSGQDFLPFREDSQGTASPVDELKLSSAPAPSDNLLAGIFDADTCLPLDSAALPPGNAAMGPGSLAPAGAPGQASSAAAAHLPRCSQHEIDILAASLPQSYNLATSPADRDLHARLLKQLRSPGSSSTVVTSWESTKDAVGSPILKLHAVFRDRCVPPPTLPHAPPPSPWPRPPAAAFGDRPQHARREKRGEIMATMPFVCTRPD